MKIGKALEEEVRSKGLADSSLSEFIKMKFEECNQALRERQVVIENELKRLEQENMKKITLDDMHTGFDKTFVAEKKPDVAVEKPAPTTKSLSSETMVETIHSPQDIKFSPEVSLV